MKTIAIVLTSIFFISCGRGYKLSELYSQPIKDSEKLIVDYGAWSDLNDGAKYGRTILETRESIEISQADQLPIHYFSKLPTKDSLFVVQLQEGGDRIPKYLSTEYSMHKGLVVKTDNYSYQAGTSHTLTYYFSDFKETNDSIVILGIEKDSDDLPNSNNYLGFKKGNIKLVEADSSGKLKRIEILSFFLNNPIQNEVDKLSIIKNETLPIVGVVNFHFVPKPPIFTKRFSDFGFLKKRKINNPVMIQ